MRQRIARFMLGRNGQDPLNIFILIVATLALVLGSFLRNFVGDILRLITLALIAVSWFRMLSKNLPRRRAENARYLRWRYQVSGFFRCQKTRWEQRRDYRFFTCPSCRSTLRVPRGRGRIRIVCRKCGSSFVRKT